MTDLDPTVRAEELGTALREFRERGGFTLAEAGQRINASASTMSRIESGKPAGLLRTIARDPR